MKARVQSKILTNYSNKAGFVEIKDEIPLSVPLSIRLEPSSICNFSCRFCANGNKDRVKKTGRYSGSMSLEVFNKIVIDIKEFERPLKYLYMYKDGEPFLNKNLPEMIRIAKRNNISEKILVTSNGSKLNPAVIDDFVDSGCDEIIISVYGTSREQYLHFTRTDIDFDAFVDNVKLLYSKRGACKVHARLLGNLFSENDISKFFEIFGDHADTIQIEQAVNFWPDVDFSKVGSADISQSARADLSYREVKICPNMFYSLSINADGTVSVCPCDWARQVVVGDLTKSSLKEIWTGKALTDFQKIHLRGKRQEHPYCGKCFFPNSSATVYLDPYAEEILCRMEKHR